MRRPPYRIIFLLSVLASFLTGCVQPQKAPFRSFGLSDDFAQVVSAVDRLTNAAIPLLVAAADLCPGAVQGNYGFELHDRTRYTILPQSEYEQAIAYFGLNEQIAVRYVHPKLPAAAAGIRAGAKLLSADGHPLSGTPAKDATEIIQKLDRRKEGPLQLVVQQGSDILEVNLYSVPACNYIVSLIKSDLVNAFADGKRIVVTTGMLNFIKNEAELAVILGHEIAHNALQHSDHLRLEGLLDALVGAHTGQPVDLSSPAARFTFSKEFEVEADYVGLYIAARAGTDLSSAGKFWQRLGSRPERSGAPSFAITHPSSPERLLAFTRTLVEIASKKERGETLMPSRRQPAMTIHQ
jgi:Zn-dependent protease with chaperone function